MGVMYYDAVMVAKHMTAWPASLAAATTAVTAAEAAAAAAAAPAAAAAVPAAVAAAEAAVQAAATECTCTAPELGSWQACLQRLTQARSLE